jgi:hypothetical protein
MPSLPTVQRWELPDLGGLATNPIGTATSVGNTMSDTASQVGANPLGAATSAATGLASSLPELTLPSIPPMATPQLPESLQQFATGGTNQALSATNTAIGAATGDTGGGTPAAQTGTGTGVQAGATGAGRGQTSEADLDEMAKKLYDKIRDRMRAELRVDRERFGRVTDLGR